MSVSTFLRSLRPGSGEASDAAAAPPQQGGEADASASAAEAPSRRALAHRLREVIDPEVGLNIVDLGLIYDIRVHDGEALVCLTMTTPACPMSSYIKRQVGGVLQRVPGLRRGIVELVWDPPWSPLMIAPEARAALHGGRPSY